MLEYKHPVLDIGSFLEDPYYLGKSRHYWPSTKETLVRMFEGSSYEHEVRGDMGSGKSTVAALAMGYCLYKISLATNLRESLGLGPDSNISVVCFSLSGSLANKDVCRIWDIFNFSPYFQENYSLGARPTDGLCSLPNSVWLAGRASTDSSALGLNIVAATWDLPFGPSHRYATCSSSTSTSSNEEWVKTREEMIKSSVSRRFVGQSTRLDKHPGVLVCTELSEHPERMHHYLPSKIG
jgi:hypothetical protein